MKAKKRKTSPETWTLQEIKTVEEVLDWLNSRTTDPLAFRPFTLVIDRISVPLANPREVAAFTVGFAAAWDLRP